MVEDNTRAILKCVRCGTCRSICPIFDQTGWESSSSRGRMMIADGIQHGLEPDQSVLDSLNTCTTCGLCESLCPSGASPVDVVQNIRRELVSRGIITESQNQIRNFAVSTGNSLGENSYRHAWLEDISYIKEHASYVFFVGCLGSYRYPELTRKTFDLLKNFDVTLIPEEVCCGSPLMRTGSDANSLVSKNIEQIKKIGAHTIITGCAGCYSTLKNDYLDNLKVVHVTEFLAKHINELKLKKIDITVTYHDPCHLGRCNGVFDAPRQIITSICKLKEMETHHEKSRCCGAGGGVLKGYPDLSLSISKKRLEEIPEGVDYLVTSCPLCRTNLKRGKPDIEVLDILDLIEMSMEK